MGKGSRRRMRVISDEEWNLRYDYSKGKMSLKEFEKRLHKINKKGKKK